MINIYQKPTQNNPTLGLTFITFADEKFHMHHSKYADIYQAQRALESHKMDLLISNLETFYRFCDKVADNPSQIDSEASKSIQGSVLRAIQDKDKYGEFLDDILKNSNFIKILVKAVQKSHKKSAIMMAATILKFCREELDEREKDKSQS